MISGGWEPGTTQDGCCPHLQPARADWIYPMAGYCRALPGGLLMIPSVGEYRSFCTTGGHGDCLFYRYRQGEKGLEESFRAQWQCLGRFSPWAGLFAPPARSEA